MKVAVLRGGLSSEREVSLRTGAAVLDAVKKLGHTAIDIDVGHDLPQQLIKAKPDVAFVALHGTYGEDGCVQGVLEMLKIPYTHSGVRASAVGMDKPLSKVIFRAAGIPCPDELLLTGEELCKPGTKFLERPFVVKPADEGSSVGVHIILENMPFTPKKKDFGADKRYLMEPFIEGKELTVAVLEGEALGVLEIRPKEGFYDYANKYTAGKTEYIVPADLPKAVYGAAMAMAEEAHVALGCRGVTRSDFRYDPSKKGTRGMYLLEINTHPGMTATSLVPKIAAHAGISFEQLIARLIAGARCEMAG